MQKRFAIAVVTALLGSPFAAQAQCNPAGAEGRRRRQRRSLVAVRKENQMAIRISLCTMAFLFASGIAIAEQPGSATGPAAGTNVEPSTAIQKENSDTSGAQGAPAAAGSPGVEAKPGSEGGKAPERPIGEGGAAPKPGN